MESDVPGPARLEQILNEFYIERREPMSEKFERTGISSEIIVLLRLKKKNKELLGIFKREN